MPNHAVRDCDQNDENDDQDLVHAVMANPPGRCMVLCIDR